MGPKPATTLALVLVIAGLLHYVLYFPGLYFSVDAWPLLHSAEKLLEEPQLSILDDEVFNGYDNHWPGVIFLDVIVSRVTGLDARVAYFHATWLVLVTALVLAAAILLRNALAPALLVLTPVVFFFAASPLKELYSYPLAYLFLYTVLRRSLAPMPLLALGLSLSHPLVPLVVLLVASAYLVLENGSRSLAPWRISDEPESRAGVSLIVLGVVLALYFATIGRVRQVESPVIGLGDVAVYMAYLSTVLLLVLILYAREPVERTRGLLGYIILALSFIVFIVLGTRYAEGDRGLLLLLYSTPVLLEAIIAATGIAMRGRLRALLHAIIIVTGINTAYTIIYLRLESLAHRLANHLVQGLALASSTRRKAAILAFIAALASSTGITLLILYNHAYPLDPTWLYTWSQVESYDIVLQYTTQNTTITGGAETTYYYQVLHMTKPVNPLTIRLHGLHIDRDELLLLTSTDLVNGLVFHGVVAPPHRITSGLRVLNKVYDSPALDAYTR